MPTREVKNFVNLFNGQWFSGPSFLYFNIIQYNNNEIELVTDDVRQEIKKLHDKQTVLTVRTETDKVYDLNEIIDFSRYSTLRKLINVVAYVHRFKNNLLAAIKDLDVLEGDLTVDETISALNEIIRIEQCELIKESKFEKNKR